MSIEFATCSSTFIRTVAIDPSCPEHMASFMRDWFANRSIPVIRSECFGYLPDQFHSFPEW